MKARTDAEWELQVRQVEALEKIADLMQAIVDVELGSIGITPYMMTDNPLEVQIIEKT